MTSKAHHLENHSVSLVDGVIDRLKHYLPSQAPLKDFIHHNTMHAFQELSFHDALRTSSRIFGTKVYLDLEEYREKFRRGEFSRELLVEIADERLPREMISEDFVKRMLEKNMDTVLTKRVGLLRGLWKFHYGLDLDSKLHPLLFRCLGHYLDQGIAMWSFPEHHKGFLTAWRHLDKHTFSTLFLSRSGRARRLFHDPQVKLEDLLKLIVGREDLYERYLFDQQFAHPGWSGLVSTIEDQPLTLLDARRITLRDLVFFELILEIDFLDHYLGTDWKPIGSNYHGEPAIRFSQSAHEDIDWALEIFHTAYERSYYNDVLKALRSAPPKSPRQEKDFQAIFCIDDRCCSLRRHIEQTSPRAETFGTPGFFGVEFFYQPQGGRFFTKLCPAPVTPRFLIQEKETQLKHKKDPHFHRPSHSFFRGWLVTQTLGFWSAFKLFLSIFRPTLTPATATSLRHMDKSSRLIIENDQPLHLDHGLQVGFSVNEMTDRVYNMLSSIGLTGDFAPLVYLVAHGSSSVNNPHYAAYDCGACSGRPGSVNARVFAHMANHPEVREQLKGRGITIPSTTRFVGSLHDTTRDEIEFFDDEKLSSDLATRHREVRRVLQIALEKNAQERIRRFGLVPTTLSPAKALASVRRRSVSLFEPRPELNHANNALCIVGRRILTQNVFLDRRAFLNSYDAGIDPQGEILSRILNAAAPVCGGINLEYYFSRVDNHKLGAGSKLPHNVIGLIGVANGTDGDLRPGLPKQMIEFHDPVRLLMIVEHKPEIALLAISRNPATLEWFANDWIHLVSIHPETRALSKYDKGAMVPLELEAGHTPEISDLARFLQSSRENLPVRRITSGGAQ